MSGNGTEFTAFLAQAKAYLAQLTVLDYYKRPLPHDADAQIAAMIDRLLTATPAQRQVFVQMLEPAQRSLFGIFAHRAATLAARQQDRQWLERGLIATAVANITIPPKRNVEASLILFHHVARKLGVNTVDLFDHAADLIGGEIAPRLRAFGRRSDVRLSSYGWRELRRPDGVQFKFEW